MPCRGCGRLYPDDYSDVEICPMCFQAAYGLWRKYVQESYAEWRILNVSHFMWSYF